MLTVITFAYGSNYTFWHAQNLRTMLEKHLTIPWRMKVVTNAVHEFKVAGFDAVKLWEVNAVLRQRNRPAGHTFARLGLFDKHIGGSLGDRLLYMPLDCIIRANIDDLIPADSTEVKVTRFLGKNTISGGPFYVRPDSICECPWQAVQFDPDLPKRTQFGDNANGLLTYLLGESVQTWNENDGIIADQSILTSNDWRIFVRTGNTHVWTHGQPEQKQYLEACGRCTFTPQVGTPAAAPPAKRITQFTVRPRNKLLRKTV